MLDGSGHFAKKWSHRIQTSLLNSKSLRGIVALSLNFCLISRMEVLLNTQIFGIPSRFHHLPLPRGIKVSFQDYPFPSTHLFMLMSCSGIKIMPWERVGFSFDFTAPFFLLNASSSIIQRKRFFTQENLLKNVKDVRKTLECSSLILESKVRYLSVCNILGFLLGLLAFFIFLWNVK